MINHINKYKEFRNLLSKYYYALFVMHFDCSTDCPKEGKEYSYDVQNFFQNKLIEIEASEERKANIKYLFENKNSLDAFLFKQIEKEYKNLIKFEKIPIDRLQKHNENINRSVLEWEKARETLDYSKFLKEIDELVTYYKDYISWQEKVGNEAYDLLLDEMEDGFTVKMYDEFFDLIKKEIVPLAKKIIALPKKYNQKITQIKFDIDKQKKLTNIIANAMGYTKDVGCIRETIHPFTNGMHAKDVRITTAYKETELFSNIFSVMHEIGHALYELGQDIKLNGTSLFGGTSCAMHESQSRFMENYLGRSYEFISYLYNIVCDIFKEEMKDITLDDLYYYANDVSNQFKRTEADELTYSIHILIRYEVEKMLFRGEIDVYGIEKAFNDKFMEYFGVKPSNMLEGCFQDIHWSESFGYFPTYALGNAFAAQFYEVMKKDLEIDKLMREGNFKPINEWLNEKIHKYGSSKKNLEILKEVCNEDFNPNYYIKYLKDKFTKIYNI